MTVVSQSDPFPRRAGWGGNAFLWMVLLSLLFHALLVAALVWVPVPRPPAVEEAVPVDLTPDEPASLPKPKPAPKPEPAPAPPPPPPPPLQPKPEPKPEEPPHAEAPPPPPKVQKTPGKLAETPTAGKPETQKPSGHQAKETTDANPKTEDDGPGEEARQPEYKGISGPGAAEATQTARDMLLAGIFRNFSVRPELRGRGLVVRSLLVNVMPNGMLAAPYDGNQPSDPASTSRQYSSLPKGDPRRLMIEEFDRAIRAAQPFHLPPALVFRAPFSVRLDFRLDDAP